MKEANHSHVTFVTSVVFLNRHVESVHERKKPFKCEICGYIISEKRQIRKSIKRKETLIMQINSCFETASLTNNFLKSSHKTCIQIYINDSQFLRCFCHICIRSQAHWNNECNKRISIS